MKTVNEALKFFIACLEAESAPAFNMAHYYQTSDGSTFEAPAEAAVHTCGTTACIAGTVALALDPSSRDDSSYVVFEYVTEHEYDTGREGQSANKCLTAMFINSDLYGATHLVDIDKAHAIACLQKWSEFDSWTALAIFLRKTAKDAHIARCQS